MPLPSADEILIDAGLMAPGEDPQAFFARAYFAGGWILLEFTDWAVGHWVLSPHITDFVVTVWLFMIPAVAPCT